jgi:hypothetical protein
MASNIFTDSPLTTPKVDSIRAGLQRVIEQEIEKILAEERDILVSRVQGRLRAQVGGIAARVLEKFEMSMRGQKLVIEVDFGDVKKSF